MEKKKYYVAVGTGEILAETQVLEDGAGLNYELEIFASPNEVRGLQTLFEKVQSLEFESAWDHLELNLDTEDQTNNAYDYNLVQIYKTIYDLGTEKTKQFIEDHSGIMKPIQHDNEVTF